MCISCLIEVFAGAARNVLPYLRKGLNLWEAVAISQLDERWDRSNFGESENNTGFENKNVTLRLNRVQCGLKAHLNRSHWIPFYLWIGWHIASDFHRVLHLNWTIYQFKMAYWCGHLLSFVFSTRCFCPEPGITNRAMLTQCSFLGGHSNPVSGQSGQNGMVVRKRGGRRRR